jgi:hypothetical protein
MNPMPGNLSRMICHRFDLLLPVFRGSKGRFRRNYRCSSFGGRCTYIHHLFQRMLLSCGVWSACGPLIACASWSERLYVWEARFSSLTVFLVPVSLWNPRDGCASVGLAAGQGGPLCMHLSRSLRGWCLIRIASMDS